MVARNFYVYILASRIGGTLYIGVTNDLVRRVAEHRLKSVKSFTKKYGVDRLVYFEQFDDAENAIRCEKLLKKWNRAWKIRLIEESIPTGTICIRASRERECSPSYPFSVMPREGGASSNTRGYIGELGLRGILDRPPSRTMTRDSRRADQAGR
jgi:putative endonuclease